MGRLLLDIGGGGEPCSLHITPLSVKVLRLCLGDFFEDRRGRTGGGVFIEDVSMLETLGGSGGPLGEVGTSRGLEPPVEEGSQT